jgi:hypothetical protein
MRIRVRRHERQTAGGKTVTVRAHEREGDGSDGTVPVPEWSRPAFAGDLRPEPAAAEAAQDWWDDDAEAAQEAGAVGAGDMSPAFAAMVRQNPALGGEAYRHLKALRDSGYDGPAGQEGSKVTSGPAPGILADMQRAPCPECGTRQPVSIDGGMALHDTTGNLGARMLGEHCRGSGTRADGTGR